MIVRERLGTAGFLRAWIRSADRKWRLDNAWRFPLQRDLTTHRVHQIRPANLVRVSVLLVGPMAVAVHDFPVLVFVRVSLSNHESRRK